MSFHAGEVSAPYCFSLYFYPKAVPRAREIWAALPVARRSETQTVYGLLRGCTMWSDANFRELVATLRTPAG